MYIFNWLQIVLSLRARAILSSLKNLLNTLIISLECISNLRVLIVYHSLVCHISYHENMRRQSTLLGVFILFCNLDKEQNLYQFQLVNILCTKGGSEWSNPILVLQWRPQFQNPSARLNIFSSLLLTVAEQTNCTINKTLTLTYTIEADKISRSEKKKSLQNPHIFQGTIWRLFVNHVLCFLCKHGQVVFQNGHIHWKPFSNAWIILFGVSNHDSIFLNGRVENNMVPWI